MLLSGGRAKGKADTLKTEMLKLEGGIGGGRFHSKGNWARPVAGGGSCGSSGLLVGDRLHCPTGPGLRTVRDMWCLVGQGEGELVAIAAPHGKGRARCAAAGPEPESRLPDPLAFPPAFRKESLAVD